MLAARGTAIPFKIFAASERASPATAIVELSASSQIALKNLCTPAPRLWSSSHTRARPPPLTAPQRAFYPMMSSLLKQGRARPRLPRCSGRAAAARQVASPAGCNWTKHPQQHEYGTDTDLLLQPWANSRPNTHSLPNSRPDQPHARVHIFPDSHSHLGRLPN